MQAVSIVPKIGVQTKIKKRANTSGLAITEAKQSKARAFGTLLEKKSWTPKVAIKPESAALHHTILGRAVFLKLDV